MGLDTVELVMEIEDAFDISIPDDQASKMLTVRGLYEFILQKTAHSDLESKACITAAAFYELRRHMRSIGLIQTDIRPKTKLEDALPLMGRRSYWQTLSSMMDLRFPRLRRPSWLSRLNCFIVILVVAGSFLGFAHLAPVVRILAALVVGIGAAATLWLLTQPYAIYPAATCSTIRDFVTSIVAINYTTLATRYSTRSPTNVWNALQLIVAEQLGVDRSAVVPHARFVQDLGAD